MALDRTQHIRDVMTPNPESVSEKDSLRDVARIMKNKDTGVVPVVDGKKVVGLITDRDIVVRGLAEGKDLEKTRVNELMTKSIHSVREDSTVREALDLMGNAEIRRVPVVNGNNELVGIVSLGDIASQTNQDSKVGKAVEEISQAPPNN
ncbi:MAG TPA: CBS domain-containing protein [Thermoanaerobaculia bacterium]|jgi:CBS domain-containing protein|nr:CBS domain-containing protein [Thermoanaerobaculia bacterium]